jgi:hypothetical protein
MSALLEQYLRPRAMRTRALVAVAGGLSGVHEYLNTLYPFSSIGESSEALKSTSAYQAGIQSFPASPARKAISAKWIAKIEEISTTLGIPNIELTTIIRNDADLRAEFETDWLDACYSEILDPLGVKSAAGIWTWIILRTVPATADVDMGVSGGWHYDNHYPPGYFKIMFYLNDTMEHHSGTDFFDAETSRQFSDRTGYIGFAGERLNELSGVLSKQERKNLIPFRPRAGDAAIFWPSRVLHRGIYPRGRTRYAISFSFMPLPKLADASEIRQLYDLSLPHFKTGFDGPSFFLTSYPANVADQPEWLRSYFERLADVVRARSDPMLDSEFDLIGHIIKFMTLSDTERLRVDLLQWAMYLEFKKFATILELPLVK